LAGRIEERTDSLGKSDRRRDHDDRARDHDGHARDHDDRGGDHSRTRPFERKPGHRYAKNYPDPITGHPLQVYPLRDPDEFDSLDDYFKYQDALTRWTNYLPPQRRIPAASEFAEDVPVGDPPRSAAPRPALRTRHVGIRLTQRDFEMLLELARAHAVRPGTMARMLVVRGVRAAAHKHASPS
jgi:hypothetical protein